MNYKLLAQQTVPQLNAVFGLAAADDKSCYLVRLNSGFTDLDLNKCLNFQAATGAGYVFDAAMAASSGICTVLAKGTNCVRTIDLNYIRVSDCVLTAVATGLPTHLIVGGIMPVCLTLGTDVTLLYPDSNIKYDATGYKTQITVNAFVIPLANMWLENLDNTWTTGDEICAFDRAQYNSGATSMYDYVADSALAISGDVKPGSSPDSGISLGLTGVISRATKGFSPIRSFTIDCTYRQNTAGALAEFSPIRIVTSTTDRFWLEFNRQTNNLRLVSNGSVAVTRPAANYAALSAATTDVSFKYTYDDTTSTHSIYVGDVLVDSFVYAVQPCTEAPLTINGGVTASASATYVPTIDRYRVRTGVH